MAKKKLYYIVDYFCSYCKNEDSYTYEIGTKTRTQMCRKCGKVTSRPKQ